MCQRSSPLIIWLSTRLMPERQHCPALQGWSLGMWAQMYGPWKTSEQIITAASHPLNLPVQPHFWLFTATRLAQLSHSLFSKCKKWDSKAGCNWVEYSCANNTQIIQKVVPGTIYHRKPNFRILRSQTKIKGKLTATYTLTTYRVNVSSALSDSPHTFTLIK